MSKKQTDVLVGVGCFVTYRDPTTNVLRILIGERKGSHGANTLQLPGGHFEMFEEFETCAQREILEETNINLPLQDIKYITATNNIMADIEKHYVTIFMICQISPEETKNVKVMEPHKLEGEWQWVTVEELKNMEKTLFSPLQKLIDTQDLSFLN
jgi:8-oxo-dGTP diphosphatase